MLSSNRKLIQMLTLIRKAWVRSLAAMGRPTQTTVLKGREVVRLMDRMGPGLGEASEGSKWTGRVGFCLHYFDISFIVDIFALLLITYYGSYPMLCISGLPI